MTKNETIEKVLQVLVHSEEINADDLEIIKIMEEVKFNPNAQHLHEFLGMSFEEMNNEFRKFEEISNNQPNQYTVLMKAMNNPVTAAIFTLSGMNILNKKVNAEFIVRLFKDNPALLFEVIQIMQQPKF